jgi:hypothetical protein
MRALTERRTNAGRFATRRGSRTDGSSVRSLRQACRSSQWISARLFRFRGAEHVAHGKAAAVRKALLDGGAHVHVLEGDEPAARRT